MKKITVIFIVAVIAIIIIYDVWALVAGGAEATISSVLLNESKNYPIIPFTLGVVCGHLFWENN